MHTDQSRHSYVYTPSVYTEVVLDKIEGFDWDSANVAHILRHAVTPFDVEEVTGNRYAVILARTIKAREAMEAVWQDGVRAVFGRGIYYHPPQAVPDRDRL